MWILSDLNKIDSKPTIKITWVKMATMAVEIMVVITIKLKPKQTKSKQWQPTAAATTKWQKEEAYVYTLLEVWTSS